MQNADGTVLEDLLDRPFLLFKSQAYFPSSSCSVSINQRCKSSYFGESVVYHDTRANPLLIPLFLTDFISFFISLRQVCLLWQRNKKYCKEKGHNIWLSVAGLCCSRVRIGNCDGPGFLRMFLEEYKKSIWVIQVGDRLELCLLRKKQLQNNPLWVFSMTLDFSARAVTVK